MKIMSKGNFIGANWMLSDGISFESHSGNYRPSGFLATDYCVYSTASMEIEKVQDIKNLPNGIIL